MIFYLFLGWILVHQNSLDEYNFVAIKNIKNIEIDSIEFLISECRSEECELKQYLSGINKEIYKAKINEICSVSSSSNPSKSISKFEFQKIYKIFNLLAYETELKIKMWYLGCATCKTKIDNFDLHKSIYIDISVCLFMQIAKGEHYTKEDLKDCSVLSEKGILIYNSNVFIERFFIKKVNEEHQKNIFDKIILYKGFFDDVHNKMLSIYDLFGEDKDKFNKYFDAICKITYFRLTELKDMILNNEEYCDYFIGEFPILMKLFSEIEIDFSYSYEDLLKMIYYFKIIDLCAGYLKKCSIETTAEKENYNYVFLESKKLIRDSLGKIIELSELKQCYIGFLQRYKFYINNISHNVDGLSFIYFVDFINSKRSNDDSLNERIHELKKRERNYIIDISENTAMILLDNYIFYLDYFCKKYYFVDKQDSLYEIFEKMSNISNDISADRFIVVQTIEACMKILYKILITE